MRGLYVPTAIHIQSETREWVSLVNGAINDKGRRRLVDPIANTYVEFFKSIVKYMTALSSLCSRSVLPFKMS